MKKNKTLFIFTFVSLAASADDTIIYKVQKNNTLSEILYSLNIKPIYGKNGFLNEVIALNSKRLKKGGDLIHVGEEIFLPARVIKKDLASEIIPTVVEAQSPSLEQAPSSFIQHSYFSLTPQLSRIAINTVNKVNYGGTDSSNISPNTYGVKGAWNIAVTPLSSLSIFSSIDFLDFYRDSVFAVSHTKFKRVAFGIGGENQLNDNSQIAVSIKVNQNYFIEVVSPYNIQMRSISQVELEGDYIRNLFTLGKVKADLSLGAIVILPSQDVYKSDLGYGYNLAFKTKFLSKDFKFSYTQKFFKINNMSNDSKEILGQFSIDLGDNK